ncbi:unnamed protein product [Moneuplotes crassus]|uniref:Major facilitator superfamily (MFS) profile domain-containing protein n=1 Tax=Euplotes crassus TaxID=5936 RepID=A0AAD1UJX7_EUPCR|nr:unnamed protein product [Moneuplotes crassus]
MEIEDREKMTIDSLFGKVSGRFQIYTTLVYAIGFCMGGFLSFALPLVELFPQFQCYDSSSKEYTNCDRLQACESHNWTINWNEERSIHNWITEMNLYCAEKWKIGLFGSMYYLGSLLGTIVFINLSDIYGRKICTRVSYILCTISFSVIIFSSNLYARYWCIFLYGFIGAVRCSVSFTTGCEFLQKKYQIWSSSICQIINACVPMLLSLYFWKITDYWAYFFYSTLTICILNCLNSFFIPESPRWLFSQQRDQEAVDILNEIARMNNKDPIFLNDVEIIEGNSHHSKLLPDDQNQVKGSPLTQIWTSRKDRYNLIVTAMFWLASCIMNYIMNFYIKYVPIEHIFLMIFVAAIAEFSSKTINGILINKIGFTEATQLFQLVCVISAILYLIFSQHPKFVIIVIFVLKLAASANFASMHFSCPKLFDSKIAVTAYNICNSCGRIGAVIAPLLAEIPGRWPMVIFLGCSIVSLILVCGLR